MLREKYDRSEGVRLEIQATTFLAQKSARGEGNARIYISPPTLALKSDYALHDDEQDLGQPPSTCTLQTVETHA